MDKNSLNKFFEGMDEKEAQKEILELVSEYCDRYHNTDKNKPYEEGNRIRTSASTGNFANFY